MEQFVKLSDLLAHKRRYIGQEYDEPYIVAAVPVEVIEKLPRFEVPDDNKGWFDDG